MAYEYLHGANIEPDEVLLEVYRDVEKTVNGLYTLQVTRGTADDFAYMRPGSPNSLFFRWSLGSHVGHSEIITLPEQDVRVVHYEPMPRYYKPISERLGALTDRIRLGEPVDVLDEPHAPIPPGPDHPDYDPMNWDIHAAEHYEAEGAHIFAMEALRALQKRN